MDYRSASAFSSAMAKTPDRFWRRIALGFLLVLALFVAQPYVEILLTTMAKPVPVEPKGRLAEVERSTVTAFERVAPSVVQVTGALNSERQVEGTGFVWDVLGHVVTNNHVVQGVRPITLRLASGELVPATLVGSAPDRDLAVLRMQRRFHRPAPLALGTSADLKVGQAVYAIGNPFGLSQSLSTGIISGLKRRLPSKTGAEISDVIQTDAAINPGSSGGPLLDSAGRLIGVMTAIYSPSGSNAGVGFAIPVDAVRDIVPGIIAKGARNDALSLVSVGRSQTAPSEVRR